MHEYICENCGAIKEAAYASQMRRFCSHKCANEWRWKHETPKRVHIVCKTCGSTFDVLPSDHRLKVGDIKFCSKRCASEARKSGKIIKCEQCGKEFYSTRSRFCSTQCVADYRSATADKHPYTEGSYIAVHVRGYNKKGNAKQHRIIMENHLGRKLLPNEVVHHINGDKTDNRIENLQVMTKGENSRFHRKAEKEAGKHLFGGHNNN